MYLHNIQVIFTSFSQLFWGLLNDFIVMGFHLYTFFAILSSGIPDFTTQIYLVRNINYETPNYVISSVISSSSLLATYYSAPSQTRSRPVPHPINVQLKLLFCILQSLNVHIEECSDYAYSTVCYVPTMGTQPTR